MGSSPTLMCDLVRVSQLARSFLVHLQEGKVVLGWTVWALESDGTDLNPAFITLCDPSQPQLCPVRNEGNTTSLISCCKDEIAWWRSESGPASLLVAAAKSLQSCPTLCDPIDGSPPGSPVPGSLQARTLEWVAIPFSNA